MLNELLELAENHIHYAKKITPIIRKQAAPVIKDRVILWLTDWLNSGLDKVINEKAGSGLDLKTLEYIHSNLIKAAKQI